MGIAAKVLAIVWKDVASELRTKEMLSSMFIFALLVILIFNFAFELKRVEIADIAPGILWVAFTFAGVLGLNRSFVLERDNDCLDGLILCPLDRGIIYLGKMVGNLIFMSVVEAITLPIFAVLFDLPISIPRLIPIIALGTFGFAAVGTLLSAIAASTRMREAMLPVLLFPLVVPVVIAAVKSTGMILDGKPLLAAAHWLQLLFAFDIIFLVVCFVTFDFVVEE